MKGAQIPAGFAVALPVHPQLAFTGVTLSVGTGFIKFAITQSCPPVNPLLYDPGPGLVKG